MAQILSNNLSGFIPADQSNNILRLTTRGSALLGLSKIVEMNGPTKTFPVQTVETGAYWVGEGEKIQTGANEWINVTLTAKKLGVIIPVSKEALNDSTINLFEEHKASIAEAFAKKLDAAAFFGTNSPWGTGKSIVEAATSAGNVFQNGSVVDQDLAGDVSDLMALIEEDGYDVNGFVGPIKVKNTLRKFRDANGAPIFQDIHGETPANIYGQPMAFMRSGVYDSTASTLIAGNWDYVYSGILEGISYEILKEATVGSVNLAEQDMLGLKATMRVGFLVIKEDAFANMTPSV